MADDHQVARLCLVTGLDHPAADFDHWVRTIAGIRGAAPLVLHSPMSVGKGFGGVIDLVPMWVLAPMAGEFFGSHWEIAVRRYRDLVDTVLDQGGAGAARCEMPPEQLSGRIRDLTRIGEAVPVLCDPAPHSGDIAPILDAIVRYLPSPMQVWQPEHTLDC